MYKKDNIIKKEYISFLMLSSALIILWESIRVFKINISNISISYSVLLLPFILYISSYILSKYGVKKSIICTFISALSIIPFMAITSFAAGKNIEIIGLIGNAFSFIVSLLVNIIIYLFIKNNTKQTRIFILFNYMFSLIVFHMMYTLSHISSIEIDGYWNMYVISVAIETLMCIPITLLDRRKKKNNNK